MASCQALSKEIFNIIKLMSIGEVTKPIKKKNSVIFLNSMIKEFLKVEEFKSN